MDRIFKALSDRNRRLIITLLKSNQEMSVNGLLANFNISQSTLSNHLSILKKAKLVKCTVLGKQRIYSIDRGVLEAFVKELNKFIGVPDVSIREEIKYRGEK